MIIKMSNNEFQEMRKFILAMKNPKANKVFNEIFSKQKGDGIKGFVNPIDENEIIIKIPDTMTLEVEKVFVKYAPDIAKMTKGGASIANAPKWLMCIKNIFADITNAFSK